ncbi:MAG: putative alpha/beta superfamily hydrolase [Colwellia sp.]|jgi:predicted alpha/beta superfamily hydrolase
MNKSSFRKFVALCLVLYVNCSLAKTEANYSFEIKNSEILTIESKVLGRKYDLNIKIPRGYFKKENKSKKYPVLYLNDAPHTFKVAAGVTHFPSMDRAIVVGISFAHGENGQYSRVRDLTPEIDESWTKYKTGGAPKYLEFIEDEVFAFVENNYRINVNQRILAGHSLGGSFGAWVLLTKPELFSSYILTSPSLWYKNDWIFDLEEKYFKSHTSLNAKVYIATGALETLDNGMRNDMVDGHVKFLKRLHSRNYQGIIVKDEIVDGTDHYSTFPVGLAKGLMFIYKDL